MNKSELIKKYDNEFDEFEIVAERTLESEPEEIWLVGYYEGSMHQAILPNYNRDSYHKRLEQFSSIDQAMQMYPELNVRKSDLPLFADIA